MKKPQNKLVEKIFERLGKLYKSITEADWDNPRNILTLIACVIMPFVAWYYISTGFILGLLMSISILWLLEKSPVFIKDLVAEYPLAADFILSTLAVTTIGGYFGAGLTLGLGAVFATVILSWGLSSFAEKFKKEQQYEEEAQH
jgi:hypothetical protein